MNVALLDQFVSVIPGVMFIKPVTPLSNEGECIGSLSKENISSQNLVINDTFCY